jgi:sulfur-carrier protein
MARGTIRYWAAARAAAGVASEPFDAGTLAEALETARLRRDADFERVLARSSYLVNGDPVGTRPHAGVALPEDAVIEVLPPFAGG